MLTDCLEACQNNESCSAVNYETGLCVLFSTTADKLPGNIQFFTLSCVMFYLLFNNGWTSHREGEGDGRM